MVCSAQNNESGEYCAIKKIENVFEDISFSKRTLRELRILRQLKHENIIDITDIFIPQDYAGFSDVYVVSALMETDLTFAFPFEMKCKCGVSPCRSFMIHSSCP